MSSKEHWSSHLLSTAAAHLGKQRVLLSPAFYCSRTPASKRPRIGMLRAERTCDARDASKWSGEKRSKTRSHDHRFGRLGRVNGHPSPATKYPPLCASLPTPPRTIHNGVGRLAWIDVGGSRLVEEKSCCNVWLSLSRDDDTLILVVKPVLTAAGASDPPATCNRMKAAAHLLLTESCHTSASRMKAASFSMSRMNSASPRKLVTRSIDGGIACSGGARRRMYGPKGTEG